MSTATSRILLLLALLVPSTSAMAATTQILCTDMPNVNCEADLTKPSNCRDILGDSAVKKAINAAICCTGSSSAKVFVVPAAPTPPAEDKICSEFSMKVSGKGANKKLSVDVDKKHCDGAKCPTVAENEFTALDGLCASVVAHE